MDDEEFGRIVDEGCAALYGPSTPEKEAARKRLREALEECGINGGWLYDLAGDAVIKLQPKVRPFRS